MNFNIGLMLGVVLGVIFLLQLLFNLYLMRKVFKLYERLAFEKEKKASYREYSLNATKTGKFTK